MRHPLKVRRLPATPDGPSAEFRTELRPPEQFKSPEKGMLNGPRL